MAMCKCKGCERRYIGCHAQCEDYKEYKQKLAEEKRYVERQKAIDSLSWDKK